MSLSLAVWLVIVVALVAANLPFVNDRVLAVGPRRTPKTLWWRLAELVVCYGLAGALWEFYATTVALFLTFAFPGFTWRYLYRRRR
jgi:hypothetical protein